MIFSKVEGNDHFELDKNVLFPQKIDGLVNSPATFFLITGKSNYDLSGKTALQHTLYNQCIAD